MFWPTWPPLFIRMPKHQFSKDPRCCACSHYCSPWPPLKSYIRPLDVQNSYYNPCNSHCYHPGRLIHRHTCNPTSSQSVLPVNCLNQLITGVIKEQCLKQICNMNCYENDRMLLANSTLQETLTQFCCKCKQDIAMLRSLDINNPLDLDYNLKKAQLSTHADLTHDEIKILAHAKDWQKKR